MNIVTNFPQPADTPRQRSPRTIDAARSAPAPSLVRGRSTFSSWLGQRRGKQTRSGSGKPRRWSYSVLSGSAMIRRADPMKAGELTPVAPNGAVVTPRQDGALPSRFSARPARAIPFTARNAPTAQAQSVSENVRLVPARCANTASREAGRATYPRHHLLTASLACLAVAGVVLIGALI